MLRRLAALSFAFAVSLSPAGSPARASGEHPSAIVFARLRVTDSGHYSHPSLWTIDADGSRLHPVLGPDAAGNDVDPAWSPDGRRIAFVQSERHRSSGRLFVVGSNGRHLVQITPPWLSASAPSWAPDGSQIVFSAEGTRNHRRSGWDQIWIVDADGGHLHPVTRSRKDHRDPDWSPDGARIAYERVHQVFTRRRMQRTGNIHVKRLGVGDGRGVTDMIAGHEAFEPAWSPDGASIAFVTYRDAFSPFGDKLWIVNAAGSDPREIRHVDGFVFDRSPVWSPGGGEILFSEEGYTRDGLVTRLMIARSDGQHVRTLLERPNEFFVEPDWTGSAA